MGRRVIYFLSRLWFAGFCSSTDSLSPAPLSLLRGDGDSALHMCVSPGTLDGSGKGVGAESQTCMGWMLQASSRIQTQRWRLVLGTFLRDLGRAGGMTPMGEKGGGRIEFIEKLTRSLADPLGCSKDGLILQGVPRWGGGAVPLCPVLITCGMCLPLEGGNVLAQAVTQED